MRGCDLGKSAERSPYANRLPDMGHDGVAGSATNVVIGEVALSGF
jgi:hypothetical protein